MARNNNSLWDTLFVVSLTVIVLSLVFLGFKMTGNVTSTGIVNVTVSSIANINFTTNNVNFGAGAVTAGQSSATVNSLGTSTNGNWTAPSTGFILQNIGNNNVSVDLMAGKNATVLLGGTSPSYQYNVTNNKTGSCTAGAGFTLSTFANVNITSPGTRICSPLMYNSTANAIRVDVQLVIPSDATPGTLSDTFTATGTAM